MLYISIPDINSFLQYQEKSLKSASDLTASHHPLWRSISLMISGFFSFISETEDVFSADVDMHSAQTTSPNGTSVFKTPTWLEIFHTTIYISEKIFMAFFLLSKVQRSYFFLSLCPDTPEHQANSYSPSVQALQWIQLPSTQDTA